VKSGCRTAPRFVAAYGAPNSTAGSDSRDTQCPAARCNEPVRTPARRAEPGPGRRRPEAARHPDHGPDPDRLRSPRRLPASGPRDRPAAVVCADPAHEVLWAIRPSTGAHRPLAPERDVLRSPQRPSPAGDRAGPGPHAPLVLRQAGRNLIVNAPQAGGSGSGGPTPRSSRPSTGPVRSRGTKPPKPRRHPRVRGQEAPWDRVPRGCPMRLVRTSRAASGQGKRRRTCGAVRGCRLRDDEPRQLWRGAASGHQVDRAGRRFMHSSVIDRSDGGRDGTHATPEPAPGRRRPPTARRRSRRAGPDAEDVTREPERRAIPQERRVAEEADDVATTRSSRGLSRAVRRLTIG
jgi:hypothetical protein